MLEALIQNAPAPVQSEELRAPTATERQAQGAEFEAT
jgi:hypothetical protein